MTNTEQKSQFETFSERILESKHAIWFDYLGLWKKRNLFREWQNVKFNCQEKNQKPSLRKFLYKMRNDRRFKVPVKVLRNNILNNILS